MFSKAFLPFFLFSSLAAPSIYFMMSPLSEGELDHNFYDNDRLFTRFGTSKVIYKTSIEDDSVKIRDYLLNGSFNLYWGDPSKPGEGEYSNAFLLNVLYPDHVDKNDPNRLSYTPRYLFSGEDITLLVGTSFSFVRKIFSDVDDWNQKVNNCENELTLSSNTSSNKFYFSHPFPVADEKKQNSKINQDYLYRLDTANDLFKHMDFGLQKPHYFEVDKSNVSAVYAGVDLAINKRLLDLNFQSQYYLEKQILDIHHQPHDKIEWINRIGDKKIATDFAVLKLKLKASDLRHPFMSYLKKLYSKETIIPKVLNTHMNLVAGKTDSIFMGGWSKLSSSETDLITMDNLFIKAEPKAAKQSEISNKKPSEFANTSSFDQTFDLKVYDKYSKSESASESSNYEITDRVFHHNDPSGVLTVKFKVKNKKTHQKSSEKTVMFSGLKSTGATIHTEQEAIEKMRMQKQLSDMDLVQFLEAEPKAVARWKEMHINHSYFYSESLNNVLFGDFYFRGETKVTEDFEIENTPYLDISHSLNVPNLNFKDAKGMIALTKKHEINEKVMIGMYEGSTEWNNVISGQDRYVGKIMLFISPFRYDLFNESNNLSKPSLADTLKKKNMDHRLIQTNRFYSSYSSSRGVY